MSDDNVKSLDEARIKRLPTIDTNADTQMDLCKKFIEDMQRLGATEVCFGGSVNGKSYSLTLTEDKDVHTG